MNLTHVRQHPLSTEARKINGRIFNLAKENSVKDVLYREWVLVSSLMPIPSQFSKHLPDGAELHVTFYKGDLIYKIVSKVDNCTVYLTKKEFRNLSYSLIKILNK